MLENQAIQHQAYGNTKELESNNLSTWTSNQLVSSYIISVSCLFKNLENLHLYRVKIVRFLEIALFLFHGGIQFMQANLEKKKDALVLLWMHIDQNVAFCLMKMSSYSMKPAITTTGMIAC